MAVSYLFISVSSFFFFWLNVVELKVTMQWFVKLLFHIKNLCPLKITKCWCLQCANTIISWIWLEGVFFFYGKISSQIYDHLLCIYAATLSVMDEWMDGWIGKHTTPLPLLIWPYPWSRLKIKVFIVSRFCFSPLNNVESVSVPTICRWKRLACTTAVLFKANVYSSISPLTPRR